MTGLSFLFTSYSICSGKDKVWVTDGTLSSISSKGNVNVSPTLSLSSVLHVPKFATNLLSISRLTKDLNCSITFFPSYYVFQDLDSQRMIGSGREAGLLDAEAVPSTLPALHSSTSVPVNKTWLMQWHNQLGHLSFQSMKFLFPNLCQSLSLEEMLCEVCQLSKHVRHSYPLSIHNKSSFPFHLLHSGVWEPSPTTSLFRFRYFVTFVDDYSKCTWVYLMKTKDEVCNIFQKFHKMIQTQFDAFVRILRSDNGDEYISSTLQAYLTDCGIEHQTSGVGTPQQNGVVECKNHHLLEVTKALLFSMNVPKTFWSKALLTASYLINRMPSRVLNFQSPFTILCPSHPLFLIPPRILGCIYYVHTQP